MSVTLDMPQLINPNKEATWSDLYTASIGLDDTERIRIAGENRMRTMVEENLYQDGHEKPKKEKGEKSTAKFKKEEADYKKLFAKHEKELIAYNGKFKLLAGMIGNLQDAEANATKAVELALKEGPFWDFCQDPLRKGVGPKQLGRLLGVIGHPCLRVRNLHDDEGNVIDEIVERRTVSQLWKYCGYSPEQTGQKRRNKTITKNHPEGKLGYNPEGKTRAYLIAVTCMKQTATENKEIGHYREVYEEIRAKYAGKIHTEPCKNTSKLNPNGCATMAHPEWGEVGSPWRDGHQLANALRILGKTILKDLWIEGNRQLEETS